MAKFRLMSQHYINDYLLEPGTIVGDGTQWPVTIPSFAMEGEDEEGRKLCAARKHNFNQPESAFPVQPNTGQTVRPGEPGARVELLQGNSQVDPTKPIDSETAKAPIEGNMTSMHTDKPPPPPAPKPEVKK